MNTGVEQIIIFVKGRLGNIEGNIVRGVGKERQLDLGNKCVNVCEKGVMNRIGVLRDGTMMISEKIIIG